MRLTLSDSSLRVDLGFWESIPAARTSVKVLLEHIESVTSDPPKSEWREIRAPGSFIPGLIKAGAYRWWGRKKDFWFVTRGKGFLVINCKAGPYRRVVLTVDDNEGWTGKIRAAIPH